MKRNTIIILIVLVLAIIAVVLYQMNTTSTIKSEESAFAVEDTSLVTKIFIADKNNNSVTLSREGSGQWLVNGRYLAHDVKVASMLSTLHNLSVRAPAPLTSRNSVITRMAGIAKKVEIYEYAPGFNLFGLIKTGWKERPVKTYYIGDQTPDNQGTYMLMEGTDSPYIVYIPGFRGFVSARYSPFPTEWRDHTVFKTRFKDIASVEIEYPYEPEKSFRVVNNPDRSQELYDLQTGEKIPGYDTARMLGFMTSFHDIRFESFLNDNPPCKRSLPQLHPHHSPPV
jgi:hypothetical protein